eukprot:scaffold14635_cov201-Amphora_coffeaeformis.AAC.9
MDGERGRNCGEKDMADYHTIVLTGIGTSSIWREKEFSNFAELDLVGALFQARLASRSKIGKLPTPRMSFGTFQTLHQGILRQRVGPTDKLTG